MDRVGVYAAALSPAVAQEPRTLPVLAAALVNPDEAAEWFDHRPPQRPAPYAHDCLPARLVAAAVRCADDFDQLLPVALGIAATARPWSRDETWGPLLAAAFPQPPTSHAPVTGAQRAYLLALVDNDTLWSTPDPARDQALSALGLPKDRDLLTTLATTR